jgi:uncharacterized Zn finger protein
VQKIKQAIQSTLEISKAVNNSLFEEKRCKVLDASFHLDESSSSMVSIPAHYNKSLQQAKRLELSVKWSKHNVYHRFCFSLKAYETAKKTIKDYHDNALSGRIASLAKSRELAVSRASTLGAFLLWVESIMQVIVFSLRFRWSWSAIFD